MNKAPDHTPCILAMDTATGPCSVAVWKGGKIAAYVENAKPVMQSASLMPMVEEVLARSHTSYKELTALAVTLGPGSFTGIRVALAAARAICFATGIEGMGYTTLEVLAFAARKQAQHPILAVLNAGKGEHYCQYYSAAPWQAQEEPMLGTLEAALAAAPSGKIALAGNAVVADARFSPPSITFPRADSLAELAALHPEFARRDLRPFYIRPPDAKLPQAKGQ